MLRDSDKRDMKVPIGWPDLTRLFSKDYEHLKLSEILAFLGDRGRYLIGLNDVYLQTTKQSLSD